MQQQKALKHPAARQSKLSAEWGKDITHRDMSREKTDDNAREAESQDKEDEAQVTKTRSGQTTKPAPRLTLKVETRVKPIWCWQSPINAAVAAAMLMLRFASLKGIFRLTDPMTMIEEAEWQIVTGFLAEVVEMIERLDEGLPGVNLECLTPKAWAHLKHMQYLDLLDDLRNNSNPEPDEVWKLARYWTTCSAN